MYRSPEARDAYRTVFKHKLGLNIPFAKSECGGDGELFEWIRPSDYIKFMDQNSKLQLILGAPTVAQAAPALELFWKRYEAINPSHQVFQRAREGRLVLNQTLPFYFHADEGRTLKKKPVFIIQWQPCCGKGVGRKNSDASIKARLEELRLQPNFKGHTFVTRFLAGLLLGSSYADKPQVLSDLIEHICLDMKDLGDNGIQLSQGHLWLCPIGNKGDWSYLVQVANLTRSYRNAPKRASSKAPNKCICHLCMAGAAAFPYEDMCFAQNIYLLNI